MKNSLHYFWPEGVMHITTDDHTATGAGITVWLHVGETFGVHVPDDNDPWRGRGILDEDGAPLPFPSEHMSLQTLDKLLRATELVLAWKEHQGVIRKRAQYERNPTES